MGMFDRFKGMSKDEVINLAMSKQKKLEKAAEAAKEAAGTVLRSGLTVGTAFGISWARGRYDEGYEDDFTFFGVPIDLGLGIGLHVVAFLPAMGKYAEHMHSVGDGALSAYAALQGYEMGRESQEEAKKDESADASSGPAAAHAPYNNLPQGMPFGYGFGVQANQYGPFAQP